MAGGLTRVREALGHAVELYHQLVDDDPSRPPSALIPAPLTAAFRWTLFFYRELSQNRAFERAGVLAYGTLVSLVPMLALVFAILGATGLLRFESVFVDKLLFRTLLGDMPGLESVLLPGLQKLNLGTLGAVATIGWLWVGARIYMTMEQAYNDIYHVKINRTLGQRFLNFYLALTAGPVVIGLGFFASTDLAGRVGLTWWSDVLVRLLPPLLLALAIRSLPCTRVDSRAALLGGFVSGALLEGGAYAFASYARTFGARDPIVVLWGSIGLIPVFLLWLYLLWVFVLLGVEIAYVAEHYPSLVRAEREQRRNVEERLRFPGVENALEVAATVAAAYASGRGPIDDAAIAEACRIGPHRVLDVLDVLEKGGLMARSARGWLLTRPPDQIKVGEVVEAWRASTRLRLEDGDPLSAHLAGVLARTFEGSLAEASKAWVRSGS